MDLSQNAKKLLIEKVTSKEALRSTFKENKGQSIIKYINYSDHEMKNKKYTLFQLMIQDQIKGGKC